MKIRSVIPAIAAAICLLPANASAGDNRTEDNKVFTRGIGVYPGDPAESFAPVLIRDSAYRNLALNRPVTTSSDFDCNLTGQLVTDGIVSAGEVSFLDVYTPGELVGRIDKEAAIDGGKYSRNKLAGEETFLDYHWNGYLLRADSVSVSFKVVYTPSDTALSWNIICTGADDAALGAVAGEILPGSRKAGTVETDPNKQQGGSYSLPDARLNAGFPLTTLSGTQEFKIAFSMKGAVSWSVREISFYLDGREIPDVLPSYRFSSVWRGADAGDEWVMTDLGAVADIDRVTLRWVNRPADRRVEVSSDGTCWEEIHFRSARHDGGEVIPAQRGGGMTEDVSCNVSGRYVRVSMSGGTPDGKPYAMTELEVWGKGGVVAHPSAPRAPEGDIVYLDGGDWRLQRASEVPYSGARISSSDYCPDGWLTATVPATILTSYVNAGAIADPNYDDNINRISESFFNSDFWYRREFDAVPGQWWLCFDGINWKAEIWLNGKAVDFIEGAFARGRSEVTLKEHNVLAVRVIANTHFGAVKEKTALTTGFNGGILGADNPTFHASIGWDWITTVRGRNSGIWNDVYLSPVRSARLSDPLVSTMLSPEGKASMTVSVEVDNPEDSKAEVTGWIGDKRFAKTVSGGFCGTLTFSPEEFPSLKEQDMRLWWPNGYGEPYLYDAGFEVSKDGKLIDSLTCKAGIREVRSEDAGTSLKLYVNGRRVVPLGGNWGFSESNLNYREREYDIAVGYHRLMNCNMIRNWVGQIGDEEFYDACDRNGIMVWQDFWLANPADGPDPSDDGIFIDNARDVVRRIRRHPSVVLYCGRNEGYPPQTIDKALREDILPALHPGIPYISSSADDGVSGHGPYKAMTPKYYFEHQSGKLHSERGMPNVPVFESLSRMLAPGHLWPQNDLWGKHDYTLEGAQGASSYNEIISRAFGECSSAEEFTALAQWIDYDGYRAMYESCSRDRLGLLIWMSHSCWPSMTWCTYDYYFEPGGAFFGVKKACEPLHIQLNASTGNVEVVNTCAGSRKGLRAEARIYDYTGGLLSSDEAVVSCGEDSTTPCMTVRKPDAEAYYVKLSLTDASGETVSDNFYILGREDGNTRAVRSLPEAKVRKRVRIIGNEATVTLKNMGKTPALLLRLTLKASDGEEILPVEYSDNYFSLMGGESKTVTVRWNYADTRGLAPEVTISGLNLQAAR